MPLFPKKHSGACCFVKRAKEEATFLFADPRIWRHPHWPLVRYVLFFWDRSTGAATAMLSAQGRRRSTSPCMGDQALLCPTLWGGGNESCVLGGIKTGRVCGSVAHELRTSRNDDRCNPKGSCLGKFNRALTGLLFAAIDSLIGGPSLVGKLLRGSVFLLGWL